MRFKVGDRVVYPNQGVAVIEDIATRKIGGMSGKFYILAINSSNSTVMIPRKNIETVGLRRLSPKSHLKKLYAVLEGEDPQFEVDWKQRYRENVELMKTGDLLNAGTVLKSLYCLSRKKNLGLRDQRMLEAARQLVVSEVGAVRNLSGEEALKAIEAHLNKDLAGDPNPEDDAPKK